MSCNPTDRLRVPFSQASAGQAMADEYVMIESSPERPNGGPQGLPGPEWVVYPYVYRTRVALPPNDQMTKDREKRLSKGRVQILRWDVPRGTVLTFADLLDRLHKDYTEPQLRNVLCGNNRLILWQRRSADGSLEWGVSAA